MVRIKQLKGSSLYLDPLFSFLTVPLLLLSIFLSGPCTETYFPTQNQVIPILVSTPIIPKVRHPSTKKDQWTITGADEITIVVSILEIATTKPYT